MAIDDLTIINNALARLGSKPIFARDEETALARKVAAVYDARVDDLLGRHTWEFNKRTYSLTQLAETALNGWSATGYWGNGYRYAYEMPGDRIATPRKVLWDARQPNNPLRDYLVEEGRIYAERTPLWATFGVRVAPDLWSPAFRLAATVMVAGDLAVPVAHDSRLAAELFAQGEGDASQLGRGGLIGRAIDADVSGSPGPAPVQAADDLTTAHLA